MELFKLFGTILVENQEALSSLKKTTEEAAKTGDGFGDLGKKILKLAGVAGFGALATAGVKALTNITEQASTAMDEIDKMSQRLGMSTQAYQEWDYILKLSGSDINSMTGGMKNLNNLIQTESEKSKNTLQALGLSVAELKGKSQEEAFEEVINAFQGMADGAEKAQLANEVFGKSGQNILPLLNSEAGSIDELKEQAHELGLVFDDASVKAGAEFNDSLTALHDGFTALKTNIGVHVMPIFKALVDFVVDQIPTINRIFDSIFDGFEAMGKVISPIVDGIIVTINALIDTINALSFGLLNIQKISRGHADWEELGKNTGKARTIMNDDGSETYYSEYYKGEFANGGIVGNGETAIVGEKGAELLSVNGGKASVKPLNGSNFGATVFNITVDASNIRELNDLVRIAKEAQQMNRMGVAV